MLRHLTSEQNLIVGGHMVPNAAELKTRLDHVYTLIPRLADLRNRTAGFMSGGEQQLLLIGRAMMAKPQDHRDRRAVPGTGADDDPGCL